MPAIFTVDEREALRHRMIEAGWECLLERGYRGMRVEDVARLTGIAQGTFYSFFKSKREFVAEMVINNRHELQAELRKLQQSGDGSIGREELGAWMRTTWHNERVIFRCIELQDYQRICELLPDEVCLGPELEGGILEQIGHMVDAAGGISDLSLAAALQRTCALTLLARDQFEPDVLERTIDAIIEATLNALYGRAENN